VHDRSKRLLIMLLVLLAVPFHARGQDELAAPWAFALGNWDLVETVHDADGELIQTNIGSAVFSSAMNGECLEESQSLLRDGETVTALQLFVLETGTGNVEVVRADSGHSGFWILAGKLQGNVMVLAAKYPDAASKVTRRITYERVDDNHFARKLEFSRNQGKTWFVRSEWVYTRR